MMLQGILKVILVDLGLPDEDVVSYSTASKAAGCGRTIS
jgi:hypothetical protein